MIAGYGWNSISKGRANTNHHDVVIDEYNFGDNMYGEDELYEASQNRYFS